MNALDLLNSNSAANSARRISSGGLSEKSATPRNYSSDNKKPFEYVNSRPLLDIDAEADLIKLERIANVP